MRRITLPLAHLRVPRFTGAVAGLVFLGSAVVYGVVKGEHVPAIVAAIKDTADAGANAMGMRIATVSLSGQRQVSREEIFAAAGVTDHSSLLFLDVADARARLEAIPWIAEATVRKLYPDRLQITVTEREPFALWQQQGKVKVIAADGTVLSEKVEPRLASLSFVVGNGAAARARDFLAVLDKYPSIRDSVRASIYVAERRWNLRLKNGIDVRLPETNIEGALESTGAARSRKEPALARHHGGRPASRRPPDGAALRRRRAGARGSRSRRIPRRKGATRERSRARPCPQDEADLAQAVGDRVRRSTSAPARSSA